MAGWRGVVDRALAAGQPGPVHLNVALREPLVPDGDPSWPEPLDAEIDRLDKRGQRDWGYADLVAGGRTVVVAGDQALADARGLAEAGGWPLLAEPSSGTGRAERAGRLPAAARPPRRRHRARGRGRPADPVPTGDPAAGPRPTSRCSGSATTRARPSVIGDAATATGCTQLAGRRPRARAAVDRVLAAEPVTGLPVARALAAPVPPGGLLVAGSSSSIRDLDLAEPWADPPLVLANRGASGIDGTVSTAVGAALAHGGDRRTR